MCVCVCARDSTFMHSDQFALCDVFRALLEEMRSLTEAADQMEMVTCSAATAP